MSIRLDPRRLGYLKQLAAEAGVRPGDLVRQWVEERIEAERGGAGASTTGGLADRFAELLERVTALEIATGITSEPPQTPARGGQTARAADVAAPDDASAESSEASGPSDQSMPEAPAPESPVAAEAAPEATKAKPTRARTKRVAAAPRERVALHDEMIAVIQERGPMTAGELATAISERGRYAPPRSGKPLDAAMVSQRVSNPTYRSRFTRDGGRIGLAEIEGT